MSNQSGSLGSKPSHITYKNKYMLDKKFTNKVLGIELTSYIDDQQNVWFLGKDVAGIIGYSNTKKAILNHVDCEDKKQLFTYHSSVPKMGPVANPRGPKTGTVANPSVHKTGTVANPRGPKMGPVAPSGSMCTYINESGFYSLLLSSKLEKAKKFKRWVTSQVLPSIRKYGQYKMFNCPWNKMIMIGNETDLHYKVVQLIRRYYPDSLLVAGLGENQDTEEKRLDSYKKGYQKGQPDLMILDYHRDYKGLCIEFKSPTNIYCVSEAQLKMKKKYKDNGYAFLLSNDYDSISKKIHLYMAGVRIRCEYCPKAFCNKTTLNTHLKVFHRIDNLI